MKKFSKVFIANRGEIAVRIIRACRDLGLRTVQAHSDADAESLPVQLADEAIGIGPGPAKQSYLNHEVLVDAASRRRGDRELSGRTSSNVVVNLPGPAAWIGRTATVRVERAGPHSVWGRAI